MAKNMVREAVAVFHSVEDMETAIDELLEHGFDRSEISLLASRDTIEKKLGTRFESTRELEDNPDAPETPYLARESFGSLEGYAIGAPLYVGAIIGFVPVVASGGAIAAVIAAAAIGGGAGAAIGGILARLIGKHHANFLNDQLEHGGILLWVRTRDAEHEERATKILARYSAEDVHVHGLPDVSTELAAQYERKHAKAGNKPTEYKGVPIAIAPDGHCHALGRLFASEKEAHAYIDHANA